MSTLEEPSPPLPRLSPRRADSHKGDFGRALLVGGSRGMTGAIAMAGLAALRGGAGLVTLAVPDVCQTTVAGFEPSYMTLGLPSDTHGRIAAAAGELIRSRMQSATCLAVGPGLGLSADLQHLVTHLYQTAPLPVVIDADGLNALATRAEPLAEPAGARILTPHPGEFRRLAGMEDSTSEQRAERAVELAGRYGVVIVLKGHRTLVTDGVRSTRNTTGNPGMATGGAGDVLTGVITALICQGLDAFDAARLGVFLHGLAGDLAAAEIGQTSLIATDLLRFLPAAFRQFESW